MLRARMNAELFFKLREHGSPRQRQGSALALLVALVLGADDHHLAVSLDYLALIAHRLYRRSNFHNKSPLNSRNSRDL